MSVRCLLKSHINVNQSAFLQYSYKLQAIIIIYKCILNLTAVDISLGKHCPLVTFRNSSLSYFYLFFCQIVLLFSLCQFLVQSILPAVFHYSLPFSNLCQQGSLSIKIPNRVSTSPVVTWCAPGPIRALELTCTTWRWPMGGCECLRTDGTTCTHRWSLSSAWFKWHRKI